MVWGLLRKGWLSMRRQHFKRLNDTKRRVVQRSGGRAFQQRDEQAEDPEVGINLVYLKDKKKGQCMC